MDRRDGVPDSGCRKHHPQQFNDGIMQLWYRTRLRQYDVPHAVGSGSRQKRRWQVKIVKAARMRKRALLRASGNMRTAMPRLPYIRPYNPTRHPRPVRATRQIRQRSFMQNTNDIVADKAAQCRGEPPMQKRPWLVSYFNNARHACGIRCQLVDGHHGNFRPTSDSQSTNHVTPDATKAINRYAYGS